ncbi:MAG: flippase-like domain-containing protein [Defluviitaleaceae bacterium]|nr:flippase-like domain-containing protein [Defluviitaleaceae bacterium]
MKKYIKPATAIVIAVLLVVAIAQIDRENLIHSVRQIPIWLIALMVGLQVVTQILVNLQWYTIARMSDISITFRSIFLANCQGNIIDSITPGIKFGGEVARAVKIKKIVNCTVLQAAALVAVQKIFSIGAMLVVLSFVLGVPVLSLLLLAFLVPIKAKRPQLFRMKSVWVFLLSLLIWMLYPLKMYIVVMQFFSEANFMHVSVVTFSSYVVAMIPIFPGGLGGFEGTMTGLLVAMGVVVSDAAVITVFFRFVTFWLVMIFSLTMILFYNFTGKAIVAAKLAE